jgi:hypothetical protein
LQLQYHIPVVMTMRILNVRMIFIAIDILYLLVQM